MGERILFRIKEQKAGTCSCGDSLLFGRERFSDQANLIAQLCNVSGEITPFITNFLPVFHEEIGTKRRSGGRSK